MQIAVEELGGHLSHHSSPPVQMVLAIGALLEPGLCHNRFVAYRRHLDFPTVLGLVRDALVWERLAAHTQSKERNVPRELDCYLEDLTEAQRVQGFGVLVHTLRSLNPFPTDHQRQTQTAGSVCGPFLFPA